MTLHSKTYKFGTRFRLLPTGRSHCLMSEKCLNNFAKQLHVITIISTRQFTFFFVHINNIFSFLFSTSYDWWLKKASARRTRLLSYLATAAHDHRKSLSFWVVTVPHTIICTTNLNSHTCKYNISLKYMTNKKLKIWSWEFGITKQRNRWEDDRETSASILTLSLRPPCLVLGSSPSPDRPNICPILYII